MIEVLLYPQTVLYPIGLLKFIKYLEKLYILDLNTSKDIYELIDYNIKDKLQFITPYDKYIYLFNTVSLYVKQLKSFGEYLKYPENFKYYKLNRELFDEYFSMRKGEEEELTSIERALVVLTLAEEVDKNLLEVSIGLKKFQAEWKKFFDEKILYTETSSVDLEVFDEPLEFESLQNIEQRINALKVIFELFNWEPYKNLDTLLITEKTIIFDIFDIMNHQEKISIDESLVLIKFPQSINSYLGFPPDPFYPRFMKILTFS